MEIKDVLSSAVVPRNVNGGVRQNGSIKNVIVLSLFTCECPQSLFLEEKKSLYILQRALGGISFG